jgi:hypothetical protein
MLKDNSECPKPNNNVAKLISLVTNDGYKKKGVVIKVFLTSLN